MEIDFNMIRIADPNSARQLARKGKTTVATTPGADLQSWTVDTLKGQLKNIPLVRPEKVEQAQEDLLAASYPPDELLNRIANLLAVHLSS